MIDIYMTHYAPEAMAGCNDMAVETAMWLRDVTPEEHRLTVVYWTDSDVCERDLRQRMPSDVMLVRMEANDRPEVVSINRCTQLARDAGCEFFVRIHNDVRVSRGWLRNLVADLRAAEARHGRGRVIISPRFLPYHYVEPHEGAKSHEDFWARLRPEIEPKVLSAAAMAEWCKRHEFGFDGACVVSPAKSFTTDDGHQLMMYGCAPSFFDDVGGIDERFVGLNYGDCDWGMRVFAAGKKNLQSQGCLIGHLIGLTSFHPAYGPLDSNHVRFIDKWGEETFNALQDGSLWRRLHGEQGCEGPQQSP